MKAIIDACGKQYYCEEGTILYLEKLDATAGSEVTFENVLMVNGRTGRPYVKGAKVVAKVLKHGKCKKIKVFKYNSKKNYHRTQGHRQPYTKVEVVKVVD